LPPLSIHAWLRWDAVSRLLPADAATVLEIGAGLGSMGALLARRFDYLGLEPDEEANAIAAERTHGRTISQKVEDHRGVYDLVCAFEVLEHISDDVAALHAWRHRTRKWLMLSVPMNPERWSASDEHAGHFRRYSRESLAAVIRSADLQLVRLQAYGFPAGYALEALRARMAARRVSAETMEERTSSSGRWLQPPPSISVATWAAALPGRLIQRPFEETARGTGLVVLCLAHNTPTQRDRRRS